MPKLKNMKSFYEFEDHLFDKYTSLGYDYHRNILKNVLSEEMFANPLNDSPYRQIERLVERLVDEVKQIKLSYAYALPKDSKLIN